MPCIQSMKRELRPKNVLLRYHRRDVFYKAQWGFPPVVFVLYRVTLAVYMTTWLVLSCTVFYTAPRGFPAAVWLTIWSFTVLCCHLVLAAVITLVHSLRAGNLCSRSEPPIDYDSSDTCERQGHHLPWYIKISWVLFTVATGVAPLVTVIYFSVLYPEMAAAKKLSGPSVDDVHVHGLNTVVLLLEFMISAIPVRFYHFVYLMLYGLSYTLFSVIFWAVDHKNVLYPSVIDWNKPGSSAGVTLLLLLIGVPLIHSLLFALFKLRMYVCAKVLRIQASSDQEPAREALRPESV